MILSDSLGLGVARALAFLEQFFFTSEFFLQFFLLKHKPDIRKRESGQITLLEIMENSGKSFLMSTFVQAGRMKYMWNDGLKSEMGKKVKLREKH